MLLYLENGCTCLYYFPKSLLTEMFGGKYFCKESCSQSLDSYRAFYLDILRKSYAQISINKCFAIAFSTYEDKATNLKCFNVILAQALRNFKN